MIRMLVCEAAQDKMQRVREILARLSIEQEIELEVFWLHGEDRQEELVRRAGDAHIALIGMAGAPALACAARKQNSQCRLLLYDGRIDCLPAWIPGGPVSFCPDMDDMADEILRLVREVEQEKRMLRYQSRREAGCVPCEQILYCQSERRTVHIVTRGGRQYDFPGKLDDVQERLRGAFFWRAHQSFLVNSRAVRTLDRATRELEMENGERIPVSSRHYATVEAYMAEKGQGN